MTDKTPGTEPDKKRPPRFLLAMPDDVRTGVERAAFTHGRTVTAEINQRLRASLAADAYPHGEKTDIDHFRPKAGAVSEPLDNMVYLSATDNQRPLSETDLAMLEVFRRMPPEKQLALLSLFK